MRVGLISTAQFVPVILLALVAGASAQRCSLRGLLVAWNALRAGALGFLGDAQAVVGLTFGQLVLAAVIVGIATVFYDVSYQASLPSMIPVESISPANGLLQATYSMTQLAGPAAAGFLLKKLGLPLTVGTAFVLFLGATVSFMAVPAIQQDRTSGSAPALSIWGGLRYVWQCRPIRDLCMQAGASSRMRCTASGRTRTSSPSAAALRVHRDGNQPLLRQALMRLPWAQAPATRRRGTGHGRTESRWIKVIDLDGTDAHALFPHAPRAVKVIRRRRLLTALRPPTERAHALLGNWGRSTESPSARGASAPSLPPLSS